MRDKTALRTFVLALLAVGLVVAAPGLAQAPNYEKVPSIRYGDLHGLRAMRKTVKGLNEKTERPRFHNVWLER